MIHNLKEHFPAIRNRNTLIAEIHAHPELKAEFLKWNDEQQAEFLDFCTGVKGLRLLYDGFFKEIMNPETKPARLNAFLSELLHQQVTVLQVLPADSTRIADESSLVIMDIVVELSDGSIANVEVQRIGYLFPGQRCACYSADLLLRQYKRVKDKKRRNFSYRDIKSVYTIVLFDKSPSIFKDFPNTYYHYFEQKSDSGLTIDLLQKYILIPLDIFRKYVQNKTINSKLEAWLTLFSTDNPEMILQLINQFPEFKDIYEEAYDICQNTEKVMGMFSKELQELDKNTVQYMIDEMQDTIDEQKALLEEKRSQINEQNIQLDNLNTQLDIQNVQLDTKNAQLNDLNAQLDNQNAQLNDLNAQLNSRKTQLNDLKNTLNNSILKMVSLMKQLNFPDAQIIKELQVQYHLTEAQAKHYLL